MRKEVQPEKLRTMVRSILPSRAARQARYSKHYAKRSHRRSVRADLHNEDAESTARDLLRDVDLGYLIYYRRAADKLNHFMRWCNALTRGMPVPQKLAYVRSILPRNVIGDHAYRHWELECRHRNVRSIPWKEEQRRRAQSLYDSMRGRLRRKMIEDPELIARLNAEIKSCKQDGEPRRCLLGIHDVDAFVRLLLEDCTFNTERRLLQRVIS